ncbi:response regulator transcription factor [Amycolatopsis kentuckyensis]|uniref:response regulator transcription factor n=1 Tax=Amycolatopsis kentuckyensis TaxID=218823 RepID=UPI001FC9964D|nr:response regulator transcription factor [Amycolatopsis kentuckyensis]
MPGLPAEPVPPEPQRGRLLVADDEVSIAAILFTTFQFLGYDVVTASTGREALRVAAIAAPDLVLLDVMLPDFDGFEVYRRLRAADVTAPVLFLSARQSTDDKVRGLTLGGDDYVAKPFDIKELVARVEVLLRRRTQPAASGARVQVGRLELDRASREVWKDGAPVRLSATEFDLLCHLMTHPGKAVSKAEILAAVWGHDFHGDFGVVETYVYYLRRKLGSDLIRTVRNFGYLIAA